MPAARSLIFLASALGLSIVLLTACDRQPAAPETVPWPGDRRSSPATTPGAPPVAVPPAPPAATQPVGTQPAATTRPSFTSRHLRASDWLAPADRSAMNLDYTMTDQDGRPVPFTALRGKPMAISFIFTRCPSPNMCPLIAVRMAGLQRELAKAGLSDRVHLLLITYDIEHDTPELLRKFGADRGLQFDNAMLLRPQADGFPHFLSDYQVGVTYHEDGSISHFIELLLLDKQGRFVRDYQGAVWDNPPVLADLKRLADEP